MTLLNNNTRYLSSVARYLCKQLLFLNYLILINPPCFKQCSFNRMKKIQDFCFETPPLHVACHAGFNTWLTIKSLCDQEFCSASKMKLSGWWSLKIVWDISRDIHVCPWYFNASQLKLSGWWSSKIVWGISRDIVHVCPWYFNWFPNGEKTSKSPFEIRFIPVNFSKKKTMKCQHGQ